VQYSLKSLLYFITIFSCFSLSATNIQVTDLSGRTVSIPLEPKNIILGESRFIPAIAIVEPEITSRITAMLADFRKYDADGYQKYLSKYPHLSDIPEVGGNDASSFSIEKAIALKPDLAIFGLGGHGPGSKSARVIAQLEAAGIAVVFIDFRRKPMQNTLPSIKLLGQIFNNTKHANAFIDAYQTEMDKVTKTLTTINTQPPSVFLHSRLGLSESCCESMSHGMLGEMVTTAGGNNIAHNLLPGAHGIINYEYLLTHQPDIYIGTAIGSKAFFEQGGDRIFLGAASNKENAQQTLASAITSYKLHYLKAVQQGNAYGVWHHFYSSPFNVVAVQQMAKWFYPQAFKSLDPELTLKRLYAQFQPIEYSGQYWVELKKQNAEDLQ